MEGQRSEVRRRITEVGGRRSEVGGRRSEIGGRLVDEEGPGLGEHSTQHSTNPKTEFGGAPMLFFADVTTVQGEIEGRLCLPSKTSGDCKAIFTSFRFTILTIAVGELANKMRFVTAFCPRLAQI